MKKHYSLVQFKVTVCPYCMEVVEEQSGHCGESSAHFTDGYVMDDGDILLKYEIDWSDFESLIGV